MRVGGSRTLFICRPLQYSNAFRPQDRLADLCYFTTSSTLLTNEQERGKLNAHEDGIKSVLEGESYCTSTEEKAAVETKADSDGTRDGAMSKRLRDLTEAMIDGGGSPVARNIEAAGFSTELKQQLEERIAQGSHRQEHLRAYTEVEMPKSVGQGSRDQALAQPWTGSESLHDVNLRMLDDSRKRLRIGRSTASLPPLGQPRSSTRKPSSNSAGQRLANARDKTSIYSATNQSDSPMSEEERAQIKKELKERFSPGARAMPTTLQGLTSLANERIEDAISRGQFKDIPRGKGTNVAGQDGQSNQAMSPFLDTTEYLMNRIIQRQEIVPPWIEKQQELRRSTDIFRSRLRNDWKRHVARVIASQGGSLESQVRRAEEHSLAEQRLNGTEKESLQPGGTDVAGKAEEGAHFSQINGQGELTITGDVTTISTEAKKRQISLPTGSSTPSSLPVLPTSASQATPPSSASSLSTSTSATESTYLPFRDPTYLQTESSYHKLTIEHLNTLTRSYNLVAPRPAQKPYLSLQIELKRCYADVAPLVADEIRERASRGVCREERRRRTSRITSRGGGAATAAANEIGIFGRMGWHGAAANGEEDEENDDHNDDDDNVDDDDSDYGPFSRERKEQVKKRNAAGDQQKQQQQQQQKQWRWSGHSTSQSRLRRREEDLQKNGYGFKQLWKDLVGSFTTVRE